MKRFFQILFSVMLPVLCLKAAEPISPLPKSVVYDKAKAALGKRLFEETLLSGDKRVSCVSCHSFAAGGADPRPVSIGIDGKRGNIQAPTVYNAVFNFRQFWNGRAASLKSQAGGPIHNPVEMGMDSRTVEARLNAVASYRRDFKRIYASQRVRYDDVIDAIVVFEKALVTPNSLFDRYLRAEERLDALQSQGYRRFKELGCVTCHNGVNIGGNSFQKMGVFIPYDYNRSIPDRYSLTGKQQHKNVFKVPTLRNIVLTAPYFHDASALTLEDAIRTMSHHNLGAQISKEDTAAIVAFLKTLTGQTPDVLR